MKVRDRIDRFKQADAAVLVIAHDEPQRLREVLLEGLEPLPFPLLVDRPRQAYDAWGLVSLPWHRIWLDPQVWRQYARLLASGARIRGAGSDVLQMGGDFVVAPEGTVAYARPQSRDDRPPVGRLVEVVERLRRP